MKILKSICKISLIVMALWYVVSSLIGLVKPSIFDVIEYSLMQETKAIVINLETDEYRFMYNARKQIERGHYTVKITYQYNVDDKKYFKRQSIVLNDLNDLDALEKTKKLYKVGNESKIYYSLFDHSVSSVKKPLFIELMKEHLMEVFFLPIALVSLFLYFSAW